MSPVYLRPADGLKVRHEDPSRGHVAEDGEEIILTSYYRRRVADGDLVPASGPAAPNLAPRPAQKAAKADAKPLKRGDT